MTRNKDSATVTAQIFIRKLESETIESTVSEVLINLNLHELSLLTKSLELEEKIKLQNQDITADRIKSLMSTEKKRIAKYLKNHPRLTKLGMRETLNTYVEKIKNQTIDSYKIADYSAYIARETDKKSRMGCARELVYIYTALAELEQNQSRAITAWKAMAKAQYYYGLLTGLDDPNTYLINERASQGGEARSQNLKEQKLLQQIMFDLLYKMVPQNKWPNFPAAADAVFGPLIEKLRNEAVNFPQNESDLKAKLIDLIAKHKETLIKS